MVSLQSIVLVCCSVALAACGTFLPSATAGATPAGSGIVIRPEDLPRGWVPIGPAPLERVGQDTLIWLAAYASADDPGRSTITIQQQLTIFPTTQSAMDAYDQWFIKWFPTGAWALPPESHFTPRQPSDKYHYACLFVAGASVTSCGQLQQHANLVSLVIANIDGHSMTLAQFEQVLNNIDARMTASNNPAPTTPGSQSTRAVVLAADVFE
jgi:hypothetical protein